MMNSAYLEFLKRKIPRAETAGFEPLSPAHAGLSDHGRDIAQWMVRGGRRACFAAFGLHKTRIQLQVAKWISEATSGQFLIVAPLGVRQEFTRNDGPALGMKVEYVRDDAEARASKSKVVITNYERVRDGGIDVNRFIGASLDEASVLRSFGSKTYQEFLKIFKGVKYRFVATATPSPNRYKELIHYAGFLGIMDTGEALTRFFQRDSSQANNLTLYPHMEKQFWLWLSSWAVFIEKPSDLGYSDEGYNLPEMEVHWHKLDVDHTKAWAQTDSWGQAQLLRDDAQGLKEGAAIKRESIDHRIIAAHEIIMNQPERNWLLWHDLESERDSIERTFPRAEYGEWVEYQDGNPVALALYERHYSAHKYADGRERKLFCGPGHKTVLINRAGNALFVWRKFIDDSGQQGINCAVFRNEGKTKSSDLIREAMAIAWARWPEERLYTYVNSKEIKSTNPGACFKKAGWTACGKTKGGLIILEAVQRTAAAIIGRPFTQTVYGSQDLEEREDLIMGFSNGAFKILATKPSIAGSGCNFQRHCADAIFLGVNHKFNDFIQAIHRIQRYGQKQRVNIHILYLESESTIRDDLLKKWARHKELMAVMTALLRQYRLALNNSMELVKTLGCDRKTVRGDNWEMVHNDCVAEVQTMEADSVDMILTSIPFGNQYEYSPSYNDFGHNTGDDPFFEQMDFLVPGLLNVLRPGRIAAIHVKDRIEFGNVTGFGGPTVNEFSDKTTAAFKKHGFKLLARITIDTDVVRENNQTYRLGWSENAKDSSKMGAGMPEYVLVFRKLPSDLSNAYADVPVTKSKKEYTRADWQLDAAGLWRSSGDRLPDLETLRHLGQGDLKRWWMAYCLAGGYAHEDHVRLAKALEDMGKLPASFMLFPPISRNKDVWTDIARMKTLNTEQSRRNQEMHVCPLQFDIIKRLVTRYTNPGDLILDPFAGIGSVPYQALKMGRRGLGIELCEEYWRTAIGYCEMVENELKVPTLFDALAMEAKV